MGIGLFTILVLKNSARIFSLSSYLGLQHILKKNPEHFETFGEKSIMTNY